MNTLRCCLVSTATLVLVACTSAPSAPKPSDAQTSPPAAHKATPPPLSPPFASAVAEIRGETAIPILVPSLLPSFLMPSKVFASATADRGSYRIQLESDPDCDGANVCFIGFISGRRGDRLSLPEKIDVAEGVSSRYSGGSCGGSCAPATIEWERSGVLYTIQLSLNTGNAQKVRSALIDAARSALDAGPR